MTLPHFYRVTKTVVTLSFLFGLALSQALASNHTLSKKNIDATYHSVSSQISSLFKSLQNQDSVLTSRFKQEELIYNNFFGIVFYKPTYILPYYYTTTPYQSVYKGNTPDNQEIMSSEFKGQMSFRIPLIANILGKGTLLSAAYTQVNFWQVYAKSQYFRETNYDPELFISKQINPDFWINLGVEHQSNGRGGELERSWNRAYLYFIFSQGNLAVSIKPWFLIFKSVSSELHNPDIADYLGYGETTVSYKLRNSVWSIMVRNSIESGFRRGAIEFDVSYPFYKLLRGYIQIFSGYGQSLIEYNHYTNGAGIGISLSDWIE
jgi:phospholipase A1/A2